MAVRRTDRLNSLLKEVISEVLRKDLHHLSHVSDMIAIMSVDITRDLSFAKVYVSVIGNQRIKEETVKGLNQHAGQIAYCSSKKVVMRIFPKLQFILDEGLEKQMRIHDILAKVMPDGPPSDPEHHE
jgi:ribosome-binding factor A